MTRLLLLLSLGLAFSLLGCAESIPPVPDTSHCHDMTRAAFLHAYVSLNPGATEAQAERVRDATCGTGN